MSHANAAPVRTVERAIWILEQLAEHGEGGVSDLARSLQIHKSTVSRIMCTLERHNLVHQTPDLRYELGQGLLSLGRRARFHKDLVARSRQVTSVLAKRTNRTVNLSVLFGGGVLYLDQARFPEESKHCDWSGRQLPLHATSDGKVLLSELNEGRIERHFPAMPAYTPRTITTLQQLLDELGEVRAVGYAITIDELEVDLASVAAPIRDSAGRVVASLSLSGETARLVKPQFLMAAGLVVDAADKISERLGASEIAC